MQILILNFVTYLLITAINKKDLKYIFYIDYLI